MTLGSLKLQGYWGFVSMLDVPLPAAATISTFGLLWIAVLSAVGPEPRLFDAFTIGMPWLPAYVIAFASAVPVQFAGGTELDTLTRLQTRNGTIVAADCASACTNPATKVPCHTGSLVSALFARKFHPGATWPPRFGATPVSATPTCTAADAVPIQPVTMNNPAAHNTRLALMRRPPLARRSPSGLPPLTVSSIRAGGGWMPIGRRIEPAERLNHGIETAITGLGEAAPARPGPPSYPEVVCIP